MGKGVNVDLFYSPGLPSEKAEDLEETARLISFIKSNFPHVQGIRTFNIEMEPGAPWQLQPERFGVRTNLRIFSDFYCYHKEAREGFCAFGYHIPRYFADLADDARGEFQSRLQEIKCQRFCFIHPNARKSSSPFWGRMLCRTSVMVRMLGRWWKRIKGSHSNLCL